MSFPAHLDNIEAKTGKSADDSMKLAEAKAFVQRDGGPSVPPQLVCAGAADAIAFYKSVFGAEEIGRCPGPDGKLLHAALRIEGSTVLLADEFPDRGMLSPTTLGGTPVTIHLMVPDADAVVARAWDAGATVAISVENQFGGARCGSVRDPFGHIWLIATHPRDVTSREIEAPMARTSARGAERHRDGPSSGSRRAGSAADFGFDAEVARLRREAAYKFGRVLVAPGREIAGAGRQRSHFRSRVQHRAALVEAAAAGRVEDWTIMPEQGFGCPTGRRRAYPDRCSSSRSPDTRGHRQRDTFGACPCRAIATALRQHLTPVRRTPDYPNTGRAS
jgi:PhnB protein